MNTQKKLSPVHPGEILLEEFMKPLGLSQTRLGRDLGVSPRRINEIVHGKRAITADTALRLSRYFGNSAEFWLGLQADYDLEMASDLLADKIAKEVKVFAPEPKARELSNS
jgi:antitoxin HigA-1